LLISRHEAWKQQQGMGNMGPLIRRKRGKSPAALSS
jgi:hypothetical protein